uniref:Uncharacterized protein n=1 Tax=Mesocestoides corti TaxID=53468 RepID=A0A5K3FST6_MESCO
MRLHSIAIKPRQAPCVGVAKLSRAGVTALVTGSAITPMQGPRSASVPREEDSFNDSSDEADDSAVSPNTQTTQKDVDLNSVPMRKADKCVTITQSSEVLIGWRTCNDGV